MTKKQTAVWVDTQFVGFHQWKEAPDDIAYLRHPHRHLFKVRVSIPTTAEREIEFHQLKHALDDLIARLPCADPPRDFSWSCEQIASHLAVHLLAQYPNHPHVGVCVSEDGECGASVVLERSEA